MYKKGLLGKVSLFSIIFLLFYFVPSFADVNPGDLGYGCGGNPCPAWVNLTKGDMFFANGNDVFIVVNYSCSPPSVCNESMTVTGNFSEIGGSSTVAGVFKQKDANDTWVVFELNDSIDFSVVSGSIIMSPKTIYLNATDGNTSTSLYNDALNATVMLVNMSVPPGCPPPEEQLPQQIPLLNGTMVDIGACWPGNCTVEDRAQTMNSTHYAICGPTFGGDTTNFTAVADGGNFSNFTLVIEVLGKAKINYTENVSMETQEKAQALLEFAVKNIMAGPRIGINDTEWNGTDKPNLNLSARLTIYNLSSRTGIIGRPQIFRYAHANTSGVPCPPSICSDFVWDGENITFSVTSFSDYGMTDAINVTLQSPSNFSYTNNSNLNFTYIPVWNTSLNMSNCTLFGNFTGSWGANETNTSVLVNGSVSWINNTVSSDGPYLWNIYCYDTTSQYDFYSLNWTVILDTINPVWSNRQNSTPTNYSSSTLSEFNVTWNDTNSSIDQVFITIMNDSTVLINNASMSNNTYGGSIYNYSIVLPAGTWNWTSYANDSAGNWNSTGNWTFTISKNSSSTNLEVNETSVKKGNIINITAWASDLSLNTTIYANFTGNLTEVNNSAGVNTNITDTTNLSRGFYNISANVTGNENYTSNSTLETILIGITDLNWSNNKTSPNSSSSYSLGQNYQFNITWTGNISKVIFESDFNGTLLNYTNNTNVSNWNKTISINNDTSGNYWINFTDLPAENYNYTWYANDTNNIWIFNRWNYTINVLTITPSFYVSGAGGSWTTTTSTSVTLVCTTPHPVNLTITGNATTGNNYTTYTFTTPSTQGSTAYTCTVSDTNYSGYATATLSYAPFTTTSSPGDGITPVLEIKPYVTLAKGKVNLTLSSTITTTSKMVANIAKYEDVAIRQLNITVVNSVSKIKIMITKLPGLPTTISQSIEGKVYHYINIEKLNITDTDINKASIKFAVNKTWLTDNNVGSTNISLYRWANNKWNELTTAYLSEDTYEAFYSAESTGLSVFLIGTKGGAEVTPSEEECVESWYCTDWSECVNETQTRTCTDANACGTTVNKPAESQSCGEVGEEAGVIGFPFWSTIAVVIVIIVVVILLFTQRDKIKPFISKFRKKFRRRKKEKVEYVYKRPK